MLKRAYPEMLGGVEAVAEMLSWPHRFNKADTQQPLATIGS